MQTLQDLRVAAFIGMYDDLSAKDEVVPHVPTHAFIKAFPEVMQQSDGWAKVAAVIDEWYAAFDDEVTKLRLSNDVLQESTIGKLSAKIGHPYQSALTPYAQSMLAQSQALAAWKEVSGTNEWWRFLSFFFGANTRCKYLYTQDFLTFFDEPKGKLVTQGGAWYKTPVVRLEINFRQLRFTIVPRENQTLHERTVELVKEYAPLNIVLNAVLLIEEVPIDVPTLRIAAGVKQSVTLTQQKSIDWS